MAYQPLYKLDSGSMQFTIDGVKYTADLTGCSFMVRLDSDLEGRPIEYLLSYWVPANQVTKRKT